MRLIHGLVTSALLLVLAGCGVTDDEVAKDTTTTERSTTESSTTTTSEPDDTTTTEDGGRIDDDPDLATLLLSAEDFGDGLAVDPDSDSGIEEEFCEGHNVTNLPTRQASVGYTTSDQGTFIAEAIAEFESEDDASQFLHELPALNEVCKTVDDGEDAIPATFEPIAELGDEAIRALPDPEPGIDPFEVILVRTDERIILLASFGEEQLLTNAVIIEAVDRATP